MSKEKKMAKAVNDRRNSVARCVGGLILSVIGYVLFPLIVRMYVFPMAPEGMELDGISKLLDRWLLAGIPLVILSIPRGYYGVGGRGWLISSVLYGIIKIFWILYILNFGDITGLISIDGSNGWQRVDIVLNGFMYLMVALRLLKLIIVYGDYRDNRAAYLAENGNGRKGKNEPDNDIRVRGRFN